MLTLYRNKPLCQYGIKTQHPNYPTGNHNWICIIVRMFTTLPVFHKIKIALTTSTFPQYGKIKVDVRLLTVSDMLCLLYNPISKLLNPSERNFSHTIWSFTRIGFVRSNVLCWYNIIYYPHSKKVSMKGTKILETSTPGKKQI